ncbi:MAG: SLBB domain-containing protein [Spirochaetaceae bacterium]|jgi:electron transport complex protein RnfC|nr:SLBB domain-containing protein [Spirochaetaceae bacterium]
MKVYTFPRGGINLNDKSAPSAINSSLSFLPGIAVLPMIQHNGVHAYPVVSVGDHVEEGELVARGQGAGSANIHAPVPGKVIQYASWKLPEKISNGAVVIRMEGKFDLLGKATKEYSWQDASPFELRRLLSEYGVIEMEGRGRPLSEVFAGAQKGSNGNRTLVVRCVFDDPWLAADYCLCKERPEAAAEGALIAAKAAGASNILIAASASEKVLASLIGDKIAAFSPYPQQGDAPELYMVLVGSKYPQHGRTELTWSLRQFEKKENAPLGNLMFLGPSSLAAIYDAVKFHKPVLDRYVAVGGSAVKHPRVLKTRIGTRLRDVFAECGGWKIQPKRIAIGSPMTGRAVFSTDEPVIKTTYAVFAVAQDTLNARSVFFGGNSVLDLRAGGRTPGKPLSKRYFSAFGKKPEGRRYVTAMHCIGCGECREVCPTGLDPEDIYKSISEKKHGLSVSRLVMRCHGCGCCEAVCPSNLPLATALINPAFKGE